jgi:hypothetical protein
MNPVADGLITEEEYAVICLPICDMEPSHRRTAFEIREKLADAIYKANKDYVMKSGVTILSDAFVPFVSPVNGEYIASRNQLRDHEKKNNVVQVGSDLDGKINKIREKAKERERND